MKINLLSDLHIEQPHSIPTINNDSGADVMILAGDIIATSPLIQKNNPRYKIWKDFIKNVVSQHKHTIVIAGNHEAYGSVKHDLSMAKVLEILREEYAELGVNFLENESIKIDGVTFVGSTLWSDMNKGNPDTLYRIKPMLNDFTQIKYEDNKFIPEDSVSLFRKAVAYFEEVIRDDGDYVFVTHHAPTFLSIMEKYRDSQHMNGGYASDLSDFILDYPKIKLWVHGHMHDKFKYWMGETLVACNPRGYNGEKKFPNYKAETFDLENLEKFEGVICD
jgi:predicted phosphodiesterase